MRGRRYAHGHLPKGQLCACGCGQKVAPGKKWRRGHWARDNRGNFQQNALLARKDKRAREKDLGGMAEMREFPARWDDEWAVIGAEHLRDTEEVLDILGRYGRVEVSYTAPVAEKDPLLVLDEFVEVAIERRHIERVRKAFERAGFSGLRPEEVKYLYINGYESVEDLV